MTRIKLKTGLAGAVRTYNPGDVVDWDDDDAVRLVEAGFAEFDGPPPTRKKPAAASRVGDAGEVTDDGGQDAAPAPNKPRRTRTPKPRG